MAAKKKVLNLQWPVGGLNRSLAVQSQPPFSTFDCSNVRVRDTLLGRQRGGSRPGLIPAVQPALSISSVNMLGSVTTVETDGISSVVDDFKGATMGSAWSGASWINSGLLPSIFDGLYADATVNTPVGAVYNDIAELSTSSPYQVDIFILPFNGQHNGSYQIFARMNTATPVGTTDGIVANLILTPSGNYSGTLGVYVAGVLTSYNFTGGTSAVAVPAYFSVLINANTISVYWNGNVVISAQAISAQTGRRIGFGMSCTVAGAVNLVSAFRVQYQTGTNKQVTRRRLIAAAGGGVSVDTYNPRMTAIATNLQCCVAADRNLQCVEATQKLYVADNDTPRHFGTGGVIDATGKLLTDAGVADWTVFGIDPLNDVVVISNPLGGTLANTVGITAVTMAHVALQYSVLQGTCSYRIERGPKVIDPTQAAGSAVTILQAGSLADGIAPPLGQVPTGCTLAALYRNRLVLAAQPIAPNAWFMSRQGVYTDWNYAALSTDGGRAVAGQSSLAGQISEPLTALITHTDDYLIFGTKNTMWILVGDPAFNGQINNMSLTIGIVGAWAWCRGPAGELVWLSRDGIYIVTVNPYTGGLTPPQQISRDKLPQELIDIDTESYNVSMAWDIRDIGFHLFLTPINATTRNHWWFDWTHKSFWPVAVPNICDPYVVMQYAAQNNVDSCVLMGCRDGYIRRFKDEAFADGVTPISSYVTFGPLKIAGDDFSVGLLTEMQAMLAQNSGNVTWGALAKPSNEPLFNQAMLVTGTFARTGLNPRVRPRLRGGSALIKLSNAQTKPWALESLVAVAEPLTTPRLSS